MTDGFEVLVHEVIAAMTTWPWSSLNVSPSSVTSTAVSERSAITVPAATAGAGIGSGGGGAGAGGGVGGGVRGGGGAPPRPAVVAGGSLGRGIRGGEGPRHGFVVAVGDLPALVLAEKIAQRSGEGVLGPV